MKRTQIQLPDWLFSAAHDLAGAGDGIWLWVVAGEVGAIPVELAGGLARQLIGE